jgi:cell wall-active antibiotic response 4TMS protein YvqF
MTPARFRWGILFILVGVLILLSRAEVLNHNFWFDFFSLIPFLLIAIGIEKIFTRTRFQVVSYLSSVLLLVGGAWVAFSGSQPGSGGSFFEAETIQQEVEPSVELLEAVLYLESGDLTIRDATDDLVYGRFREFSDKPKYTYAILDNTALVELDSRGHRGFGGMIRVDTEQPEDWRLKFSNLIPLVLKCDGSESTLHLNLSTTPLRELDLNADESSIYLKLGDLVPDIKVSVKGRDAKLRLRVPGESGLRVIGIEDADYLREVGLTKQNGFFVNEGYDSLKSKIEVELDDRFQSLSIDYY